MTKKKKSEKPKAHTIKIVQLAHGRGLAPPAYQSAESAGFDLVAALDAGDPVTLRPGQTALIPTGVIFKLPKGTEGQVRPRSGLAVKHGVTVLNSPGTIDRDYRGEIQVILINHGNANFIVSRGDRVAQFILAPVIRASFKLKQRVKTTARGAGGFGSTGIKTVTEIARPAPKKTVMAAKTAVAPVRRAKPAASKKKNA